MQITCTLLHTGSHASTSSLNFYKLHALPNAQPTVSKHWKQSFYFFTSIMHIIIRRPLSDYMTQTEWFEEMRTWRQHVQNTIRYPVTSPDMLGGLSALLTSSVDASPAHGNSVGLLALTTCGTSTSSCLAPDDDGLTSTAVTLGFSTAEPDSSVLGTGWASWNIRHNNAITFYHPLTRVVHILCNAKAVHFWPSLYPYNVTSLWCYTIHSKINVTSIILLK